MKPWWKSKTIWLNTLVAMLTVAEANVGLLREHLGPSSYLAAMVLVAGLNFFLRTITTESVK